MISSVGLERRVHVAVKSYAKFSATDIINGKQPFSYRSIVTRDNLNCEILGPDWLVYAISAGADIILKLYNVILELCDRLYLNESAPQVLGSSVLEERRLEERLGVMLMKQSHHGRQRISHSVVVTEYRRSMSRP